MACVYPTEGKRSYTQEEGHSLQRLRAGIRLLPVTAQDDILLTTNYPKVVQKNLAIPM